MKQEDKIQRISRQSTGQLPRSKNDIKSASKDKQGVKAWRDFPPSFFSIHLFHNRIKETQMNETIKADVVNANRVGSRILSASSLSSDDVYNPKGEELGSIEEIMLDIDSGKVRYAVMSFGGFLGMGEKLFAVPWSALTVDTENKRLVMDTDEERLKAAPGFDSDNWPNMADAKWEKSVHAYYGTTY